MVLNPRVELWTQIFDAEHRGINPIPIRFAIGIITRFAREIASLSSTYGFQIASKLLKTEPH
jgi:hypothetical protein